MCTVHEQLSIVNVSNGDLYTILDADENDSFCDCPIYIRIQEAYHASNS